MTSRRSAKVAALEARLEAMESTMKANGVHPDTRRTLHRLVLDALLEAEQLGYQTFGIVLPTPASSCDHEAHAFYTGIFHDCVTDRWRVTPSDNIKHSNEDAPHCGWIFSR